MCISITPDDNCQYWKNLDEMKLSSPDYPKFYLDQNKPERNSL